MTANNSTPPPRSLDGSADIAAAVASLAEPLPQRLKPLAELAYNYWWSWAPGGREVFAELDAERWRQTDENPVRLLQETRPARLREAADDASYAARIQSLAGRFRAYMNATPAGPDSAAPVAHMCAEFGVHGSLPIYAGGLGVLMGDWLKELSDQALPALGVGLLYWQGSFHQRLDQSGWQHEYWLPTDSERLPMAPVRDAAGRRLQIGVPARGRLVLVRVWRVNVGRVPLFLLDTNDLENAVADRWIGSRLYVGDREMRLAQYAVLGIGGVRALREMGIQPSEIHLNEGHAALAGLELVRERLVDGAAFDDAVADVRRLTSFTTHTPVPAGHDTFAPEEVQLCLAGLPGSLSLDWQHFLALGRTDPNDSSERFGTTPLALRLSSRANGVSRRHGQVSREMWQRMWPDRPADQVPIGHVTNGVHLPTWMAPEMQGLLDRYLPRDWRLHAAESETWSAIDGVPDEELWAVRSLLRQRLVRFVREQSVWDRLARGESAPFAEAAANIWDDDVLTLGFVRRIATYKRLYLLISDPARGIRLLGGPPPVQVAIAGKAHPQDEDAKRTVQQLLALNRMPNVAERTTFLEDLDLTTEPYLVQGCDIWINLPRPPNEASGTSGMKSALNGGLQLSVLDGWWEEAFDGVNGWGVQSPPGVSDAEQDAHDAEAVYSLLESEIVPLFYDRAPGEPTPHAWVQKIKASLKSLGPRFNASRMVQDYLSTGIIPRP